jgi:predicted transcriptional regulator
MGRAARLAISERLSRRPKATMGYNGQVTAKEALKDLVDDLSEQKAAEVLEWLEWEVRAEARPLTSEERAAIDRGLADIAAGRLTDQDDLERDLEVEE